MAELENGVTVSHSFARYRKNRPKLEKTFQRGLRLLDEHIRRHERQMFAGATEDDPPGWNARLAKQGEDLVKSLNSLGQMYLKIQQVNEKMAESMSVEEQVDAFLTWAKELGRNNWLALLRGFRDIEYEREEERKNQRSEARGDG